MPDLCMPATKLRKRQFLSPPTGDGPHRTILVGETPDAAKIPAGCRFHPRCPLAFDRCTTEEPPLFDVGGGQQAACWLAEGGKQLPVMPITSDALVPAELPAVANLPTAPAAPAS